MSCYLILFLAIFSCNSGSVKLRNSIQPNRKHIILKDEDFFLRNLGSSMDYKSNKPAKSTAGVTVSPPTYAPVAIKPPTKSPVSVPSPTESPIRVASPTKAPVRFRAPTNPPVRVPSPISSPPIRVSTLRGEPIRVSGAKALDDYSCSSPDSRKEGIMISLSKISEISTLQESSSPQGQASKWIIEDDMMELCPDSENLLQRYALALFYFSTNGDQWTRCFKNDTSCLVPYNWRPYLSGKPECKWVGTFCNSDGDVTGIIFKQNGMSGVIPSEITSLSFLEAFVLEGGDVGGIIPENMGALKRLKFIDFSNNRLNGEIPESLYDISTLVQLDLSHNELTGTISPNIGSAENLEFLQLEGNQLSGDVPAELGSLDSLQEVTLMDNQFSGSMPQDVCVSRDNAGGTIQVLTFDCTDQFACDCCTLC